ncbi:MAG: M28 family metallopeptidase [bacterium]
MNTKLHFSKVAILLPLIFVFISFSLFSQNSLRASEELLRETINVLCSDTLAGRGFGFAELQKAEHYIQNKFEVYGVEPLGYNYSQQVELYRYDFSSSEYLLRIGVDTLKFGFDFGYGLFEKEGFRASTGGNAIQFKSVFEPDRETLLDKGWAAIFYKNREANDICKHIGAEVCISIMTNDSVLDVMYNSWSPILSTWRYDSITWENEVSVVQISKSKGAKLLEVELDDLDKGLNMEDIKRLKKKPPVFELMINRKPTKSQSCNIVGQIKGKDTLGGYIILSAHYDHLGYTNKGFFPGANDNASGVAVLLEVARMLSKAKTKGMQPEQNVLLITFTAEEIGLKGSRFFIDNPLIEKSNINLHINMDMVGHKNPKELGKNELFLLAPDSLLLYTKPFMEASERLKGLFFSLSTENPQRINFLLNSSDTRPFLEQGINSLLFTDGPFDEFHSFKDRPDVLSFKKMGSLSEIILEILLNVNFNN